MRRFNVAIVVLLGIVLLASSAAAQSRSESFSTRYDSSLDAFAYRTTYEFEVPPFTRDRTIQNILPSEVLIDLYWNTARVWLVASAVECWSDSSGDWVTYADTVAYSHFMSQRTTVFADECRVRLLFLNSSNDRYVNSSQRAALRINVSSTTGGNLRLTKTRSSLGEEDYTSISLPGNQLIRNRIAAYKAAMAEE